MKTFLYLALLLYSQLSWATPPEKITLQLHWKHQFEYAGYYIAKEKGYYRDAGLEVVLKELPRGRTEMELLLAGEADYAITGSNVLVDRIHGEPLVAVAAYTQYSPIALLVREDSGIRTVEDLRGKRIMVSKDNLTIFAMLNQAGLQSSDYTIQPQSFNLQDLVNGKTDAFAAFTTNQGFLLKEQGVSYRYIVPTDFGIDTYSDVLITTEQEATHHRQRLQNFRQATTAGWEYAYQHPEETIELILERYNSQNKSRAALEFEARELRKLVQPLRIKLGQMRTEKWEHIRQIYVEQQQIPAESSIEGLLFDQKPRTTVVLSQSEQAWLDRHPKFRIGVDPDWFPFEYLNEEQQHRGVVADIMQRISVLLGVEMRVVEAPSWPAMMEQAARGEVDLVTAVMRNGERERFLNFTDSYYRLNITLVTHGEQPQWESLDAVAASGATVAVPDSYVTHDHLKRDYPSIPVTTRATVLEVLQAVEKGEADLAIVTLEAAAQLIQTYRLQHLRIGAPVFETLGALSIGVRKDWPELVPILHKALAEISTQEIERIRNKWMAVPITIGLSIQQVVWIVFSVILVLGSITLIIWRSNRAVRQAQRALIVAKEQAEQASHAKGNFLNLMSHELRTPITTVSGITQLIGKTESNPENQKLLKTLEHATNHLLALISDLFDLSRAEESTITFDAQPLHLSALLEEVVERFTPLAVEKGIALQYQPQQLPHTVVADSLRLQQILNNLLGNAIKHNRGGWVRLEVMGSNDQEGGRQLRFNIRDNGVGIDPARQQQIFLPFEQVEKQISQQRQGAGLGLAICKQLVETMGGSIGVESNPGEGSCFWFELNLAEVDEVIQQPQQQATQLPSLRILIAEDNETNRMVITQLLEMDGHQIDSVEDGEAAVQQLSHCEEAYDLLLMDVRMPRLDGPSATQQIRAQFSHQQLPIIALTADTSTETLQRCKAAGMDQVISKPFLVEELYRVIGQLGLFSISLQESIPPISPAADVTGEVLEKRLP